MGYFKTTSRIPYFAFFSRQPAGPALIFYTVMDAGLKKRIGKALLLSLFISGFMYVAGFERYDYKSMHPAIAVLAVVFLRFLIFLGVLNLLNFLKNRQKQ